MIHIYYGTDETDATGHYSISSGLGTGTYMVTAYVTGGTGIPATNVSVTAGQETSNVDIQVILVTPPPPTFSGTITGRVTNASNSQPIADAHVVAEGDTSSYGSNYTDTDGYYIIAEDLDTDTYTVTASAFGYQDANLTMVKRHSESNHAKRQLPTEKNPQRSIWTHLWHGNRRRKPDSRIRVPDRDNDGHNPNRRNNRKSIDPQNQTILAPYRSSTERPIPPFFYLFMFLNAEKS